MRVNAVGDNRIDIYLSDSEIIDTFGGYEFIDYNLPESRVKINSLISSVIPDTAIPLDCKKVLIEVRPSKNGCTISFIRVCAYNKKYRVSNGKSTITMLFESSEDLISALLPLKDLNATSSQLYINGKRYALIVSLKHKSPQRILHMREYCKISLKENDAVRVQEYWHPVCKRGAINLLCTAFLN